MSAVHVYKVLLAGDSACGKSSLIRRYTSDTFQPRLASTIGVDFVLKQDLIHPGTGKMVMLQIWDVAGQDRMIACMSRVYFQDASALFVVYDITRREVTLESAKKWKTEIEARNGGIDLPCVFAGNKSDLLCDDEEDAFCLPEVEGRPHILCSAKTGKNVKEAFECLLQKLYAKDCPPGSQREGVGEIDLKVNKKKIGGHCC